MKKLFLFMAMAFLTLPASAQLLNPDFELWASTAQDPQNTNYALGWTCTNGIPLWVTPPFYYPAPTDAQSGNHALKISVFNHNDEDLAYQVASINYRPAALKGYYKYSLNQVIDVSNNLLVEDFAKVEVYLTKWNGNLLQNDTIGRGALTLTASNSYTLFSCPIIYASSEIPERIRVILDCSILSKNWEDWSSSHVSANDDGISSVFTVDNLQLVNTLADEAISLSNVRVYPNPASQNIQVSDFKGSVALYDAVGKLVLKQYYTPAGIDIAMLCSGMYVVRLDNGTATNTIKLIKE